jgi:MFS family permease
MMTLVGVGMAMVVVSARTLLQRSTDSDVLARVLAVQEGVHLTGLTVGYVAAPIVIGLLGPQYSFVPMGGMVVVIGLLSFRRIRALDAAAVLPERELALLAQVPFLAGLPPYELERLAQGARWLEAPVGAVVVRQGDPGDSYYLVASGELSVTVDGVLRPHVMSQGDGFGEIALLHRVPRTATITALAESELLVIDSADFLAAVSSAPEGDLQARAISRARLDLDQQSD